MNAFRLNCYPRVINSISYISGSILPEVLENTLLHICTRRIELFGSSWSSLRFLPVALKLSVQRIRVEHIYLLHGPLSGGVWAGTAYRQTH